MEPLPATLDPVIDRLVRALRDRRAAPDHWVGHLASSALSTATAILALEISARNGFTAADRLRAHATAGMAWLVAHQNPDGGWGDTTRSRTNISTTAIGWAALSLLAERDRHAAAAVARADAWLAAAAGGTSPDALRVAILERYGKDRTFSVPILTVLALAGKLGTSREEGWRLVPQLPFELAAFPHRWFQYLQLPVVSYALPALIAIGQVRHALAPTRNPLTRALRNRVRTRTHTVLREMQPDSGGYLEATPLTSFVVMSLSGMRRTDSPVVEHGVRFLLDSMRADGSWPIDTNLATWVTTLSVGALADAEGLDPDDAAGIRRWLLVQQSTREHPFTHAAPGAWAWTPLSGGVPDADDTAGALIALRRLGTASSPEVEAAAAGARWLLGLQNRDGGIPTFCRGWGALPFDRSTPEITAHALRAWDAWHDRLAPDLRRSIDDASRRAVGYLAASQRPEGSWIPLWFGNEHAPREDNPVYGTARTLAGLQTGLVRADARTVPCRQRAVAWLLRAQNDDGGWGGDAGVTSSIEETGVALSVLGRELQTASDTAVRDALARAACWLADAVSVDGFKAAPVGLYFARLWYYEDLYPLIFALGGLASARSAALARSLPRTAAAG
jgi:squalene-hopene/tetraprenyl-beta-curcumene cyclase